jgi:hypothetical protein
MVQYSRNERQKQNPTERYTVAHDNHNRKVPLPQKLQTSLQASQPQVAVQADGNYKLDLVLEAGNWLFRHPTREIRRDNVIWEVKHLRRTEV